MVELMELSSWKEVSIQLIPSLALCCEVRNPLTSKAVVNLFLKGLWNAHIPEYSWVIH